MSRGEIGLYLAAMLLGVAGACGGGKGESDIAGDSFADVQTGDSAGETRGDEVRQGHCGDDACSEAESCLSCPADCQCPCGNGTCDPGENCLHCPADCDCSCGDGVCTHGEFCAVCFADCDCTTVAATPPMGWNSWNLFGCDIEETLIGEIAQAMVDSGMAAAGYRYVNLDDCWQVDRSEDGMIIEDPVAFPSGIGALAAEAHGLGLQFGVYTCAGPLTCEKRPGSFGFEDIDAKTYAGWGVDYVKVDWCSAEEMNARERYGVFRDAIAKSGRPMLLSICNWGFQDPWIWGPETGAVWRTSGDIKDSLLMMTYTLLSAEPLAAFARIGHWNDPDMLEVGNGGMTTEQYRAHFSLWAVLAAPLLAGNDLRDMSQETLDILLNEEVIAVDQDPAGLQGIVVRQEGPVKVYARPLAMDGWRAVVLYNTDVADKAAGKVTWGDLGLQHGEADVRDLWLHKDLGQFEDAYQVEVPPSEAVMVRISGKEPLPPDGMTPLEKLIWKYSASYDKTLQEGKSGAGSPLKLDGKTWDSGLGVLGAMRLVVHLGQRCTRFDATVGVDDAALAGGGGGPAGGSVRFELKADGELLFDSGVVGAEDDALDVSVDLTGRRELELLVSPAADFTDGDLADWADVRLTCGK